MTPAEPHECWFPRSSFYSEPRCAQCGQSYEMWLSRQRMFEDAGEIK